ncbi:hypothetical protein [Arthrobacter sp. UYCu712]|uniref:ammonium transporter n=1 Tax=Arthrobacter sp. UYCu712 TaxID=3156340 RepID=UPI0033938772
MDAGSVRHGPPDDPRPRILLWRTRTDEIRPEHHDDELCFGWFGFNAGSELAADATAGLAWTNTLLATSAALLGWLLVERLRDGHAISLGAASGAVAGLVAVTPACGFVEPGGAIVIGAIAGAVCALAVGLKFKSGPDDSLDVAAVHFVGGPWGTLSLGFFAIPSAKTEGGPFCAAAWPSSGRRRSPHSSSRPGVPS